MDRIDKIVSSQTGMTRKEVHKAISRGLVTVDGQLIKKADIKVDPELQNICFDGREIAYKKYRYFILNKPAGLLTASSDSRRETVLDIFKGEPRCDRLFAVGRLDKDTTGLLLVTDDGDYAHRVISPKSRVEKEYLVEVDGPIPHTAVETFEKGVVLADGTQCLPARIAVSEDSTFKAGITVFEGKYHQIKRMLGVLDLGVVKLHRNRISSITLPDNLPPGRYLEISRETAYSVFDTSDQKNE